MVPHLILNLRFHWLFFVVFCPWNQCILCKYCSLYISFGPAEYNVFLGRLELKDVVSKKTKLTQDLRRPFGVAGTKQPLR